MTKKMFLLLFSFIALSAFSQPAQRMVKVQVVPESKDWECKVGEKVNFKVKITQNGQSIENVDVRYELSEDMLTPFVVKNEVLKNGEININAGTMKKPGFMRCRVFAKYNGVEYEGRATVGFSPEQITPTTKMPDNFKSYWDKAKLKAQEIPLDARLVLLADRCTEKVNVYELSFQNETSESRIYGILCVPTGQEKYPALLRVPGAGVRGYSGDLNNSSKGIITLEIGIHGIPVSLDSKVYNNLRFGALNNYWNVNNTSVDNMYYKRVYLGCVRAIDYIFSMPEFDGENLVVSGGSQGGALSIITAGLDDRVKGVVSFYPAMSDMNGYLYGRAGGWPHTFKNEDKSSLLSQEKEKTMAYYDVVNFARLVEAPVYFSFGYNDMVCPPTTSYSVYNTLKSAKKLEIIPEIEHYTYPEMWTKAWDWAYQILNVK